MNLSRKMILPSVIAFLILLGWAQKKKNPPLSPISQMNTTSLNSSAKPPAARPEASAKASQQKSSHQNDLNSLKDMSRTLFEFTRPDSRLGDLVQYLESSQQQPVVALNSNPDTGDMVIVRTRSPLPGTRYFHAQYFADENQKSFVQHMSFEFKPGATAMQDAVETLQKSFPDLPDPKTRRADFVQWDVSGGYILWVKKLTAEDLQDDPFNAYTSDDVGTVRVAMELEIHPHGSTVSDR